MGCGSSTPALAPSEDHKSAASESKGIDHVIEDCKAKDELKIKMLLLGPGESGKSTVFKQMRLLYGTERSDEDLRMYGVAARSNITVAIRKLIVHLRSLGLEQELEKESQNEHTGLTPRQAYDELIAYLVDNTAMSAQDEKDPLEGDWVGYSARAGVGANADAKLFLQHHESMKIIWESETMKQVWVKRAMVNVTDSHKDYLNEIPRIASQSYKPTTQDVLISRIRTTQVIQEKYLIDGTEYEIYDMGGQRSERRKWIPCFENVTAVIFIAALSEYDQTLAEAKRTNRMLETIELFRSVCVNRAFENTSILLFLNKKDVFAEKIQYSDIAAQRPFSDYDGPAKDYDQGVLYFIQKFKDCLMDDNFNDSFIHVTCAKDTNQMQFVLDATRTIVMKENLKKSGFLGSD